MQAAAVPRSAGSAAIMYHVWSKIGYRIFGSGLKYGMENHIFRSEIG